MTRFSLILVSFVGLGSFVSSIQAQSQTDPFRRYLAIIKAASYEPAVEKFAGNCGLDLRTSSVRYADRPENKWIAVKSLAGALRGLETDFFATVAVWKKQDRVVIETWDMELDVGSESRVLYCLHSGVITSMQAIDWDLPVTDERGANMGWGFRQSWRLEAPKHLKAGPATYVDLHERPIRKPKFDGDMDSRYWIPKNYVWSDLELPSELLQ